MIENSVNQLQEPRVQSPVNIVNICSRQESSMRDVESTLATPQETGRQKVGNIGAEQVISTEDAERVLTEQRTGENRLAELGTEDTLPQLRTGTQTVENTSADNGTTGAQSAEINLAEKRTGMKAVENPVVNQSTSIQIADNSSAYQKINIQVKEISSEKQTTAGIQSLTKTDNEADIKATTQVLPLEPIDSTVSEHEPNLSHSREIIKKNELELQRYLDELYESEEAIILEDFESVNHKARAQEINFDAFDEILLENIEPSMETHQETDKCHGVFCCVRKHLGRLFCCRHCRD